MDTYGTTQSPMHNAPQLSWTTYTDVSVDLYPRFFAIVSDLNVAKTSGDVLYAISALSILYNSQPEM